MSEVSNTAPEVDPMSEAAAGVAPPKFPVLAPDRVCSFRCAKAEKVAMTDHPDRFNLKLTLKTTKDYADKDGGVLREGFTQYRYHPITEAPERTEGGKTKKPITLADIKADLCVILRAFGKKDNSARDLLNNPSMIEGEICDMKVGLNKATNDFPESNKLTYVEPDKS